MGLHYGAARSANSVATVWANQFPRAVSRAYALPRSIVRVSMPSRPRSAIVTPAMGLSPASADGAAQTPHLAQEIGFVSSIRHLIYQTA